MHHPEPPLAVRNIDVALARAFVAVAETGGVTAAAKLLNLTQGAISQQIKRIEDLFQTQLFHRDRRRLQPTAEGERLLPYARRMIALNDEVWVAMRMPAFEGEIRLGVPRDILRPYMPAILRGFNAAWPQVHIALVCDSSVHLKAALAAGEIDLTLTTESDTPPDAERLLSDRLVWIGGKGGRAADETPLPLATMDETCTFRAVALKALERLGRTWRNVGTMTSIDGLSATLEADLAVATLLARCVPDQLEVIGMARNLPPLPAFHINLYLPTNSHAAAQELGRHIRDQMAGRFNNGMAATA
ncbi:MAG: LysR family transcriptional regulator [Alphaproteobacteria bacterium]